MSAALIKASCLTCGEVDLTPRDITLNVSVRTPDLSHYLFRCPTCRVVVQKPADENIIALLHGNGLVNKTPWELPQHPEDPPGGAALTLDDLITFGLALHATEDAAMWALPQSAAELARWAR